MYRFFFGCFAVLKLLIGGTKWKVVNDVSDYMDIFYGGDCVRHLPRFFISLFYIEIETDIFLFPLEVQLGHLMSDV